MLITISNKDKEKKIIMVKNGLIRKRLESNGINSKSLKVVRSNKIKIGKVISNKTGKEEKKIKDMEIDMDKDIDTLKIKSSDCYLL